MNYELQGWGDVGATLCGRPLERLGSGGDPTLYVRVAGLKFIVHCLSFIVHN
jgi:hypothetical protein